MIDIENVVFNTVATALRAAFTGIFVSGDTTAAPSTFPAATLVEMDNATHTATLDSNKTENHADLMYQADAYSNLASGRKSQAKSIIAAIDTQMFAMGFVRVGNSPNMDSPNYYRKIARYKCVVSAGVVSGDDTIYQIYRR